MSMDILGKDLSDIGFTCQLYNALVVVVVACNWEQVLQRRQHWPAFLWALLLPNLFWSSVSFFSSGDYPILYLYSRFIEHTASLPFLLTRWIQSFLSPSVERFTLAFCIALLPIVPVTGSENYAIRTGLAVFSSAFAAVSAALFITGIHPSLIAQLRLATISAVFFAVCFLDIRRASPTIGPMDIFPHYVVALLKTLLLFPVLIVVTGALFLVIVTVTDAIGVPSSFINNLVYTGVLYGPFAAVYWIMKSNWRFYVKRTDLPT